LRVSFHSEITGGISGVGAKAPVILRIFDENPETTISEPSADIIRYMRWLNIFSVLSISVEKH